MSRAITTTTTPATVKGALRDGGIYRLPGEQLFVVAEVKDKDAGERAPSHYLYRVEAGRERASELIASFSVERVTGSILILEGAQSRPSGFQVGQLFDTGRDGKMVWDK